MDGYVTIGTNLDSSTIDKQIGLLEDKLNNLEDEYRILENSKPFEGQNEQLIKLGNEINATQKKISRLNREKEKINQTGFGNIESQIQNVGKSIEGATKKVVRWGFAFLGLRSAIALVRQSVSTLSQYDEQLSSNIEYIRYALANTLAPVIQWILNLVVKLLTYINYIAQAWFGVNLFASSSAKAFQNAKDNSGGVAKNLKNASKNAKELNKQLAGFDEMNVLQDNTSKDTGGADGGGAGGTKLPSFDLSGLQGDVPEWMKWIADHKDEVIAGLLGIAAAVWAFSKGFGLLKSLGIGLIIGGIAYAIEGLLKYLKDPSFTNLGQIIQGIGIAVIGLGVAFFGLPAIIAGVFVLIVGTVVRYWEQIKAFVQGIIDWLYQQATNIGGIPGMIIQAVADMLQWILDSVDLFIKGIKDVLDGIIKFVKSVFSGDIKGAIDGLLQVLTGLLEMFVGSLGVMWGALLGAIKLAVLAVAEIIGELLNGLKNLVVGLFNAWKNLLISFWTYVLGILKSKLDWINKTIINPLKNGVSNLFSNITNGAKNAVSKIKSFFSSIPSFFSGIIGKISGFFRNIGSTAGNVIGGAFKGVVNGVLGAVERILNSPINAINGLIGVINGVPGINLGRLSTFNLPRLAKGGIINNPGKGVYTGTAIAGEAGREFYMPLQDEQMLSLVGEAIGRYITINANITNTMNGRVISRELQKINNESDFAYNR